jgi:hypothetical protein
MIDNKVWKPSYSCDGNYDVMVHGVINHMLKILKFYFGHIHLIHPQLITKMTSSLQAAVFARGQ